IVDRNARAVLAHTDDAVVLEKGVVVASGPSSELGADASALARYLGVS
ncbi:MAG: ABC transporter ATP-binding protein, partial [Caldimonas sp.]